MFHESFSLEKLNQFNNNTMAQHLEIEFVELGKNYLKAKMPVSHKTKQPLGLLHGGASVALAETLGSVAAFGAIDSSKQYCVGLEINANHIKAVREGYVVGIATPIHIGRKTHVWEIRIHNEKEELVCISRITVAILDIEKR